jgi:hypothetical protein
MTEIMPVPRKLRITVLPAGSFTTPAFCWKKVNDKDVPGTFSVCAWHF